MFTNKKETELDLTHTDRHGIGLGQIKKGGCPFKTPSLVIFYHPKAPLPLLVQQGHISHLLKWLAVGVFAFYIPYINSLCTELALIVAIP